MTLSIYLGVFSWCVNCSWWLIPLLLGAWILGWLLWDWTRGSRLRKEVNGLERDIKDWKKKFTETESDLKQAKYDREKLSGEFATVKSKLADSEATCNNLYTKINDLESNDRSLDVDISKWESQVADLESQLETSRNTNLKLQDDYALLKNKFTEMQSQLDSQNDYESGETTSDEHIQVLDALQTRIADLEKKLALSYEANTKMEADYAHLKSNYGDLEMKFVGGDDKYSDDYSAEREGLQARITELELLLASRPNEEESEPGEGKKKKKKKKRKNKKKKGKGKKEDDNDKKQGSGGQKSGYALAFADNNLQIVEGIGPKIEGVLQDAGVNTWKDLSQKNTSQLREILESAGPRYKMHDPSSWAQQAELANKDDWDELVSLQKVLGSPDGKESDSKAEKLYFKFLGFANVKQNDLKVIEGIGPKIESLLKDGGIKTWTKLSESTPEEIQVILDAAGSRYKLANPGTWPKQAKIADNGDWTTLKNYQDKLKGGKE